MVVLLALVAVFSAAGAAAPDPADAFIGESVVINPLTKALTSSAEKLIQAGKPVAETIVKAGKAGGVEGGGEAAGVFEGAGLLPALSFGTGTVFGSEICHVAGIEGCWYFGSDGTTEPTPPEGGHWTFVETENKGLLDYFPAWQWYFSWNGSGIYQLYPGHAGSTYPSTNECNRATKFAPSGATSFPRSGWVAGCSGVLAETAAERSSMANRVFEYHPTDNAAISNFSYSAPSNWSAGVAAELTHTKAGEEVGEHLAHELSPSTVADPYASEVEVPASCETGVKVAKCLKEAKELDLVPEVTELPWEDAVIEELKELDPEKTREEESEKIIEIAPPPKTTVETGSELIIKTNPDTEDMPEFLPKPDKGGGEDGEGEDPEEYEKRLVPIFIPGVETLSDATLDPEVGPGRVSHTVPGSRHRFNPHTEHEVNLETNPSTAPQVGAGGGGGGGSCGASVPAVDFSPLMIGLGHKFPFGLFTLVGELFGQWSEKTGVPEWDFPIIPAGFFGSSGVSVHVDFHWLEPFIEPFRLAMLFVTFAGMLWFLGTAALNLQGDDS